MYYRHETYDRDAERHTKRQSYGTDWTHNRATLSARSSVKKVKVAHTRLGLPSVEFRYKPGGRRPLLSVRLAVTLATLKRAATTQFCCLVNRGTMGVNSLPKTVTR